MDDPEIVALSEVRENAAVKLQMQVAGFVEQLQQLWESIQACEDVPLTREEIADVVRPAERALHRVMPSLSLDVVLAGNFFDRLDALTARDFMRMAYRALPPGGVFFFTSIAREKKLRECCAAAAISRRNVSIQREGQALLIEVQKLE